MSANPARNDTAEYHEGSAKEHLLTLLEMSPTERIKAARLIHVSDYEDDLLEAGCPTSEIAQLILEIHLCNGSPVEGTTAKHDETWKPPLATYLEPPRSPEPNKARFLLVGINELGYQTQSRGLIKEFIAQGAFVVIYGPSGSSKTFVAIDICLCVASGLDWHGRRVSKALVLYVASEGAGSITNRIVAYQKHYLQERDVSFFLLPAPVNLLDPEGDVWPLIAAIKGLESQSNESCGFVVIDTLSQSMPGGDENGPKDMTSAVDAVNLIRREVGCTVALVHHSGKDEAKGARGHSSLRAATDTELEVGPLGGGVFQIRPTKQRDHATGEAIPYRLKVIKFGEDEDGDSQTTCVVEPIDSEDIALKRRRRGKLGARGEILQRCMEDLFAAKRGTTPPAEVKNARANDLQAGQFVIFVSELRELFLKRLGEDPDMKDSPQDSLRKAFRRTLEAAQALGNIKVYEEYAWFV